VLDSLIVTMVWTFNLSALTLSQRADLLRQVVLWSWNLVVVLVFGELAWAFWALWTGQSEVVCVVSCWMGLNLLVTVSAAKRYASTLTSGQLVLLCSWWLALLATLLRALCATDLRWT